MDFFHSAASFAVKAFGQLTPTKGLAAIAGAVVGYFLPTSATQDAVTVAALLVAADTVSGAVAAWQTGEAIRSSKFSRVLAKLLVYSMVTGAVSLSLKVLPSTIQMREPAVMGVLGMVVLTETISILENADKMGIKIVPRWVRNIVREAGRRVAKKEQPS